MGNFLKCFDVVSMVVGEATSQFAPIWRLNAEKYQILKQYCEALDTIAEEFDGRSFDVKVDDIAMTISITLKCPELIIKSNNHRYCSLAQRAISFGFSVSEDGLLNAKFVFPSVWEHA